MDGDHRDVPGVGCARLLLPFMRVELVMCCLMEEVGLTQEQAADAVRAAHPDDAACDPAVTSSEAQRRTATG